MQPDLIYDIGCNNGDDTDYYLRKGFRVLAIDADVSLCDQVKQHFPREVAGGQLKVVHGLISNADSKTAPFYLFAECSGWNTADPDFRSRVEAAGRAATKVSAPVVHMGDMLLQHGVPYFAKSDIEGSDLLFLRQLKSFSDNNGDRPTYVSIEFRREDLHVGLEQLMTLARIGYCRFQFANQGMRQHWKAPRPAREGQLAEFQPMQITTGLFGRELDGDWLDLYAATKRVAEICRLYALFRDDPRYSKNGQFSGTLRAKFYNRFRRHVLRDPINGFELHAAA